MNATIVMLGGIALALALTACGKPFRSPPAEFEMWSKPSYSDLEIKKSLLECGHPTPYMGFGELVTQNSYALTQLCMQKNGFIHDSRENTRCRVHPNLDACKPENAGAIPDRDISRRLNAPFCKQSAHSNFPECK